jgi:hypothetical protein
MTQSTAVIPGPNKTAASPVPVGCDDEPVTDGSFNELRTKIKAPATAMSIFCCSGNSCSFFWSAIKPQTMNGAAAANQIITHTNGRKPSIMCIFFTSLIQFFSLGIFFV